MLRRNVVMRDAAMPSGGADLTFGIPMPLAGEANIRPDHWF